MPHARGGSCAAIEAPGGDLVRIVGSREWAVPIVRRDFGSDAIGLCTC